MALYDYFCHTCRNGFELMRPISEAHEPAVCPRCGSEGEGILAGGPSMDDLRPASDLEHRAGSTGGLPAASLSEDTGRQRSNLNATAVAATAPEEEVATDSRVDLPRDTTQLDMPQTTEYQPGGSNLWYIRDWGISSMFGYLRDNRETEPIAAAEDRQVADQHSPALLETDSADRPPSATEWQTATSVMPWLEEVRRESSEADKENSDITGEEIDGPGLRPLRNRPNVHLAWAHNTHTRPKEERDTNAARRSRPEREKSATDFPDDIIQAAWRRQGGRCAGCGRWLIWSHRDRDSGTGAWEAHHRLPVNQGGRPTVANCILLCSGVADCHFNIGHGGVAWSHYVPVGDLALLFLSSVQTTAAGDPTPARRKRSLWREVLGIP